MKRLDSYRRKIDYITEKLGDMPDRYDDEFMVDALMYRLHTSIESVMDIVAMLVKDLGRNVVDDYGNIEVLEELNIIDQELADKLKQLNGLRNIIVHRYNKIDTRMIIESLDEIRGTIFKFLEIVENVLQQIFR
ncbi:MAG: type VII toxin-antitoxin system HepT family RNase toxin [Candidatus Njordarchaeia archaeon]